MRHAVILVVYNRFLGECEAGRTLPQALPADSRVLVWDNSEGDCGNGPYCTGRGWTWLGGEGNRGLSRAYQACVDRLRREGFEGLVSLFDDDTSVRRDYFDVMARAAEEYPERDLFFPLLRAGGKLVSPQIIPPNQHARYFSSAEACLDYEGPDLYAFNSGMAVRSRVFDRVGYEPALFLDGVDYAFLRACYQAGFASMAVDIPMDHGFSGAQRPAYPAAAKRFENYARDYAVVLRENPRAYRWLVGKRALHLALMYHKSSFFESYFTHRPGKQAPTHKE